jgi:hypothetical protein
MTMNSNHIKIETDSNDSGTVVLSMHLFRRRLWHLRPVSPLLALFMTIAVSCGREVKQIISPRSNNNAVPM